jgi:peptide/nickel transport system permease protein
MGRYVINRLWTGGVTLLLVSFLVFALLEIVPGDIIAILVGEEGYSRADAARVEQQLGLDRPLLVRYAHWLGDAARGDMGHSIKSGRSVTDIMRTALPVTVELGLISLLLATAIGIPLGVYSAVRQNRPDDYLARLIAIIGISVPHFYLATLVIVFPAIWWGWTPPLFYVSFREDPLANLQFLIVPAIILATGPAARFARITRSAVLDTLREDYVRTARAKGVSGIALMRRHVLRTAMLPVVTVFGAQVITLVTGAVVIETIFGVPGMGRTMVTAIGNRDFPVITGVNAVIAITVVCINLLIDITYRVFDPRVTF